MLNNPFRRDKGEEKNAASDMPIVTADKAKTPILLGLDTGNKLMKTARCDFHSGFHWLPSEPGFLPKEPTDLIQYQEQYYQVAINDRLEYQHDKTKKEDYQILSLIAIAKELQARKLGPVQNIALAVGLPPGHLYDESLRKEYRKYFYGKEDGYYHFRCGGIQHSIRIIHVFVSGQTYAAIRTMPSEVINAPSLIGIDIGGYTADILHLIDGELSSIPNSTDLGVIRMYSDVQVKMSSSFGRQISEKQIDSIIEGKQAYFDEKHVDLVKYTVQNHIRKILAKAQESGLDLRSSLVVFMGGGAVLLKDMISEVAQSMCGEHRIILDIHANAQGYEERFADEFELLLNQWNAKYGTKR